MEKPSNLTVSIRTCNTLIWGTRWTKPPFGKTLNCLNNLISIVCEFHTILRFQDIWNWPTNMDFILLTKQEMKHMPLNIWAIKPNGSPCTASGCAKWCCATEIIHPFCFGAPEMKVAKGKIFVPLLMKDGNTILHDIGCMAEMLLLTLAKRLSGHVTHHLLNSKTRWGWFLKVLIRDHRFWTNTFRWPEMPVADWTNIGM